MEITNTTFAIAVVTIIVIMATAVLIRFLGDREVKKKNTHIRKGRFGNWIAVAIFALMILALIFEEVLFITALGWLCVIMMVPLLIAYGVDC